jgi:trimeric autotransporter adhesin
MKKIIAMGKIAADGTILKATPGITISTEISPGNGPETGYTVNLPDRLVNDSNYIVQLTAENYGEDGPDYVFTTIAIRYQTTNSFEVIIWADRHQTLSTNPAIVPVRTDWHFVIYDI